jgi:hypothetical protein
MSRACARLRPQLGFWLVGLQPLQYPEDDDGDGPRNVGFFAIQPLDAAGSPRRFYYTSRRESSRPHTHNEESFE